MLAQGLVTAFFSCLAISSIGIWVLPAKALREAYRTNNMRSVCMAVAWLLSFISLSVICCVWAAYIPHMPLNQPVEASLPSLANATIHACCWTFIVLIGSIFITAASEFLLARVRKKQR